MRRRTVCIAIKLFFLRFLSPSFLVFDWLQEDRSTSLDIGIGDWLQGKNVAKGFCFHDVTIRRTNAGTYCMNDTNVIPSRCNHLRISFDQFHNDVRPAWWGVEQILPPS